MGLSIIVHITHFQRRELVKSIEPFYRGIVMTAEQVALDPNGQLEIGDIVNLAVPHIVYRVTRTR